MSRALRAAGGVPGEVSAKGVVVSGERRPSNILVSAGVSTVGDVSEADAGVGPLGGVSTLRASLSALDAPLEGDNPSMLGVSARGAGSSMRGVLRSRAGPDAVDGRFEVADPLVEGDVVRATSLPGSSDPVREAVDRLRVVMVIRCRFAWWCPGD